MMKGDALCRYGAMALVLFLPGTVLAGPKHPGYSHTMDDLRLARALLQRPNPLPGGNGSQDEVSLSIGYIDAAMADIFKETGEEGQKPQEAPRIDARLSWPGHLAMSLKMLEKAELDCSSEKDASAGNGLRARVLGQLEHARSRLAVAFETVNFDYSARDLPTRNDSIERG